MLMKAQPTRKGVGCLLAEIAVSGFIVHSGDSDSDHSHKLYITSWDGDPVHVHGFSGDTCFNDGHSHPYAGWTEPAPTGVPHVHRYFTNTAVVNGHSHVIRGVTGPAIALMGGGHYHHFEGVTTISGSHPHTHSYRGSTGNEVSSM
jgi:hypothetical protein